MKRIYISSMEAKPEHCTDCPLCNEYDDCDLLPKWYRKWEEQYKDCPLREEEIDD